MKKVLFVICSLVILFPSCSQDEMTELQPNSTEAKIKAYKEYAEKLADKYGVNMQLNEENLREIVNNLSIEQMEQDFASFSNSLVVDTVPSLTPTHERGKMKIKRRVSLAERDFVIDGFISHTFYAYNVSGEKEVTLYVTLPWDSWKVILPGRFETNQHSGAVNWYGRLDFDVNTLVEADAYCYIDIYTRNYRVTYRVEVSSPLDHIIVWSISPRFEYHQNI